MAFFSSFLKKESPLRFSTDLDPQPKEVEKESDEKNEEESGEEAPHLFSPAIEEAFQKEKKKQGDYYRLEEHLVQSAAEGDTDMCRYLIGVHGASSFYEVPETFQRPATVAMEHGHRGTALFLIENMKLSLPKISQTDVQTRQKEEVKKRDIYHPNFHLLQACTFDDLEMCHYLISEDLADPLLAADDEQHGLFGFRGGDSAMIVAKRYGSKKVVEYLKSIGAPNESPPEWMAPLLIRVEADETLVESGAISGDGTPIRLHISADATAEELRRLIIRTLCQNSIPGQRSKSTPNFLGQRTFSLSSVVERKSGGSSSTQKSSSSQSSSSSTSSSSNASSPKSSPTSSPLSSVASSPSHTPKSSPKSSPKTPQMSSKTGSISFSLSPQATRGGRTTPGPGAPTFLSNSSTPFALTPQEEAIVQHVKKWKLVELDAGKPIWYRGRELGPTELVQQYCDNQCGLFLAFKLSLPQFKFVANYPSSSLVVPGEQYTMLVDCYDPEEGMQRRPLVGRLQLVIVGELEMVQCREIIVEMQKQPGEIGRYFAKWVPEYPGVYHAMTRANGVNVHEQWAELVIDEDVGLTKFRRKFAELLK